MSNKIKKVALVGIISVGTMTGLTGCVKPYQKPIFEKIAPNETAFLVPLKGNTSDQAIFESEELLKDAKVPTKEVEIPTYWVQTGRKSWSGEYKATHELIRVDRSPVTREWTNDTSNGTSASNQAVTAKTKDGIKIIINLNATAQIEEGDTPRYLYLYNTIPLSQVMDSEIKALVHSTITEEVSRYSLEELALDEIMKNVREKVTKEFKQRGIAITALGFAGDPIYPEDVQKAINAKVNAEKSKETQAINNAKAEEQAESEARQMALRAKTMQEQLKMKEAEVKVTLANKWDGKLPEIIAGDGMSLILDKKKENK